ncbi:MAG: FG-GAP-like repeat-containing protein [Polyangiaceae bacterium]
MKPNLPLRQILATSSRTGSLFLLMTVGALSLACGSVLGIEPGVLEQADGASSKTGTTPVEGGQSEVAPGAPDAGSRSGPSPEEASPGDAPPLDGDADTTVPASDVDGDATDAPSDGDVDGHATDAPSDDNATDAPSDGDATDAPSDGDATDAPSDGDVDGDATDAPSDGDVDGGPLVSPNSNGGSESGPAEDADAAAAPRPIAPLSTSQVTSQTPTFRWTLPSGIPDATLDLCLDRACNQLIASAHVTGTSYTPGTSLPVGIVYWRLHPSTIAAVTSPSWQLTVGHRSAPIDTSWGTTLDVNGDGYSDVVVAAFNAPGGPSAAGAVYVYLGGPIGFQPVPVALRNPSATFDYFGWSAASAGDLNGDGYGDLVVGARGGSSTVAGGVYVYLGGPNGLTTNPIALSDPNNTTGDSFGQSVAGAGDVNGDGYADLMVGAPLKSNGAGRAYVYFGTALGLSLSPAFTLDDPNGSADDYFGTALASAGDVNGDGYADLIVAANGVANGSGSAYLYLGAAGLAIGSPIELSDPGHTPDDYFATSVSSAGDINGDGYADLIIGTPYEPGSKGSAYVYLGGPAGLGVPSVLVDPGHTAGDGFGQAVAIAGDINGDGYADITVGAYGSSNSTGNAYTYLGSAAGLSTAPVTLSDPGGLAGDEFGTSVASAGDVNGDGYADIVVGAPASGTSTQVGAAYVYLGTMSGFGTTVTLISQAGSEGYFGFSVFGATE